MRIETEWSLFEAVTRRPLSRRGLLKAAAAMGVSAPVGSALLSRGAGAADLQAATAEAAAQPTGEITWALETSPPNVIPFGGIVTASWQAKEFMYESLLEWDQDLNILPALAESYEAPDDTTYVFHLRKGVKFHDGNEMTAKDVKYSLETAVNPPEPGVQVPFLQNIASVEAVDDFTVKVLMAKVDPTLPGTIAWRHYTPIVPDGIYDRINVLSEGIGTGPFKLTEYVQDDHITYEAFDGYWRPGIPCLAKLTLKVQTDEQARVASLRAGEIDGATVSADVARTLEKDDTLDVLSGPNCVPQVITMNTTKDVPWRDKRVRQAINLVVDRQEIVDKVFGGEALLTGAIPPGYGDWPLPEEKVKEYYTVDVEKAKQLMADAGHQDGFDVTLIAISEPRQYTQIAEIVREAVKPLNIHVEVQPLEIGTFAKNTGGGTFEWASTGRGMRSDPSGFIIDFRTGTSLNTKWYGDGWKNDELNKLYDEALVTLDSAKRHQDYNRMQEILFDEGISIYSVIPMKYQVVNNRLTGMYVDYGNTNPGLRTVCVTED